MIADLGIAVHVGTGTESIGVGGRSIPDGSVWARVRLSDGEVIDAG